LRPRRAFGLLVCVLLALCLAAWLAGRRSRTHDTSSRLPSTMNPQPSSFPSAPSPQPPIAPAWKTTSDSLTARLEEVLKAYKKSGQKEAALLDGYRLLGDAEKLKEELRGTSEGIDAARKLIQDIRLALDYFADETAMAFKRIPEMKALMVVHKYVDAIALGREVSRHCHGRYPEHECFLGLSLMAEDQYDEAIALFRSTAEMCKERDPEYAAMSAYFAGESLLRAERFPQSSSELNAVSSGFHGTYFGRWARRISEDLRREDDHGPQRQEKGGRSP